VNTTSRSLTKRPSCPESKALPSLRHFVLLSCFVFIAVVFSHPAHAQTATYHAHNEVSSTSGLLQLTTANPDVATVTLSSANLNGVAIGEYLIKEFDTQVGVPNVTGVIPSSSTLSVTLWMRKSANKGTMFPRAKVYLNSSSGTLLCTATGTTALTTTAAKSTFSCNTTANISMTTTDRFYLWVGTNVTAKATASVTAQLSIEGTLNGNYDSLITVPLPTPAPSISGLSSTSGPTGASITITGNDFRSLQGSSAVQFNGVTATPSSWSATSIVVPVPSGATTGPVVVTVGGQASNGVPFTVLPPPPQISSLSPNFGPVGAVVTITGTNFGATQGSSALTFNGTAATPISWSATSIVAPVPPGATTGSVVVTVGGQASSGVSFTVGDVYHLRSGIYISGLMMLTSGPTLSSVTSVSVSMNGKSGDQLIKAFITAPNDPNSAGIIPAGSTLSFTVWMSKSATSGTMTPRAKLYLNSDTGPLLCTAVTTTALAVSKTTPTKYVLTCTTTASVTIAKSDKLYLWVGVNISSSSSASAVVYMEGALYGNYDSYVVVPLPPRPAVTLISPASGPTDTSVTITGASFGATQGTSYVLFSSTEKASVVAWSDTSITVLVPATAASGVITFVGPGGTASFIPPETGNFTVIPHITDLALQAYIGGSPYIQGTGFGAAQGSSTITLNGTVVTPRSWNNNFIGITIPTGATTGPVVVTKGGNASNSVLLTVVPHITSVSPNSGPPGTTVTLGGTSFGATQGASTVTYNDAVVAPTGWSDTSIVVQVPLGATLGWFKVVVGGFSSGGAGFTVPFAVNTVVPMAGPIGSLVTITGTGFGATQGTNRVTFSRLGQSNAIDASPISWSDTQIVTPVPAGATSGWLYVLIQGAYQTDHFNFTVTAGLDNLSPSSGFVGTNVTISGSSFGEFQGEAGWKTAVAIGIENQDGTQGIAIPTVTPRTAYKFTPGGSSYTLSADPYSWITASTPLALSGTARISDAFTSIPLPFPFPFYGQSYSEVFVSTNGLLTFGSGSAEYWDELPPNPAAPNTLIAPFWRPLTISQGQVTYASTTSQVVISYNNVTASIGIFGSRTFSFQVILRPDGTIRLQYNDGIPPPDRSVTFNGMSATVLDWSDTRVVASVPVGATTGPVLVWVDANNSSNGMTFTVLTPGSVTGFVTDLSTTLPVPSASVSITDSGGVTQTVVTDMNGQYTINDLREGNFTGTITKGGYTTHPLSGTVTASQTLTLNAALTRIYPVISQIAVTNITINSATVTWTTDQPTDSQVEYGTTTAYGNVVSDPTLTTTHSLSLTGLVSNTTYHFEVTATNTYGTSSSSGDYIFSTLSSITLTITSPFDAEAIARTDVLVRGTLANATGQETGVVVNGVVAVVFGNEFVVNHVPLVEGANTVTVTATDVVGNTAQAAVAVTAATPAQAVTVSAAALGLAPFETTLTMDSTLDLAGAVLSYTGPGTVEFLSVTPGSARVRMTVEGTYLFTVTVRDAANTPYQDTVAVTAVSRTSLDTLLLGKWTAMRSALSAGDIEGALPYFAGPAQARYRQQFTALAAALPQIAADMANISSVVTLDEHHAEYELQRIESGGVFSYLLIFSPDEQGLWKIQGF